MKKFEFSFPDTGLPPQSPDSEAGDGVIEVVMLDLDVDPSVQRAAAALLSPDERQRAERYEFPCDRRRFTVARSCLRQLLGDRLNIRPEAVSFAYGRHGKPAVSPRCSEADLQFSVSHTGDVAVFAFAWGLDVGVDVEAVRDLCDADEIARRFFSRREYEGYRALDRYAKPLGFFTCWTRKEAFVKALGDGLYYPLDAFDISLADAEPLLLLHDANGSGRTCKCMLKSFSPGPDLVGAVVAGRRGDVLEWRKSGARSATDLTRLS